MTDELAAALSRWKLAAYRHDNQQEQRDAALLADAFADSHPDTPPPTLDARAFVEAFVRKVVRATCLLDAERQVGEFAAELLPHLATRADDGLSDEEYGRAWAKQENKNVLFKEEVKLSNWANWTWYNGGDSPLAERVYDLPDIIFTQIPSTLFCSESEAYAALGRAVREVHRQVPPLGVKLEERP